jgi:hypothetical protein
MSTQSYLNQVSRIEKEIADLQKKFADESKKEYDKQKQIDTINRSINKNTSLLSLQSKKRQIDSLRKKIDEGLVNSKYGIVIFSNNFIKIGKKWTDYELNGLIAREMSGHKVILPIWHKVTKDEILSYSPPLADKLALDTSIYSIDEIVEQLKKIVYNQSDKE